MGGLSIRNCRGSSTGVAGVAPGVVKKTPNLPGEIGFPLESAILLPGEIGGGLQGPQKSLASTLGRHKLQLHMQYQSLVRARDRPKRLFRPARPPRPPSLSGAVMEVFSFDVSFSTHDLLKEGITEWRWRRVVVAAPDFTEARLIACQMVIALGWYATGCYVRI